MCGRGVLSFGNKYFQDEPDPRNECNNQESSAFPRAGRPHWSKPSIAEGALVYANVPAEF
ncbi:hypothetical protein I7I53_05953 [Histoplasma capsulatum var. duboisii H88]|uniref:Uncharacterized protein n=1 Tax=Ajellomyces capsulatus (strain H88) TaxID=544711 RepID=A0A8A1LA17_AJEC8|nr:hypothetical protein I7I53_05953 [Histoplasma capsulatum var. duboisii H88]